MMIATSQLEKQLSLLTVAAMNTVLPLYAVESRAHWEWRFSYDIATVLSVLLKVRKNLVLFTSVSLVWQSMLSSYNARSCLCYKYMGVYNQCIAFFPILYHTKDQEKYEAIKLTNRQCKSAVILDTSALNVFLSWVNSSTMYATALSKRPFQ